MLTHFNLTSNIKQFLEHGEEAKSFREEDVILVHLPLFHIYGMNVLMNGAIAIGATQVMIVRFDTERFSDKSVLVPPSIAHFIPNFPKLREKFHSHSLV